MRQLTMIRLSMKTEDRRPRTEDQPGSPKTSPFGEMPKGRRGQPNKQMPSAFPGLDAPNGELSDHRRTEGVWQKQ